ncbi:MAG: GNAT family N-acetyltransferase [Desulfobacteraceae bacterium]|nr:GNAT family N-acetyltransferase [Desulfobacteraceae bacterium]
MIRINEIKDFNDFLPLKEKWNSLLKKSTTNSVFLSHEWIRCWWEAYGREKKISIILFFEGDNLKAIGPLMVSKRIFNGLPIKSISFIENDETPHCGLLVDRSYEFSIILSTLIQHLTSQKKWDIILFRKVFENNQIYDELKCICNRRNYSLVSRKSLCSPILKIESDWDSFYSGKSQRFKKKIRYDLNRLKKQGCIEIQMHESLEQIEKVLDDIFRVGLRSWQGKKGKSIGSTKQNRLFFSKLPRALNENENGILIWTLSLDGKIISYEYHVKQKDYVYALRGEYDTRHQPVGPGVVLDSEIVRNLFNNRVRRYNMCGDPYPYKLRWTSDILPHKDIIIFNRRPYAMLLLFLESRVRPILINVLKNKKNSAHSLNMKEQGGPVCHR